MSNSSRLLRQLLELLERIWHEYEEVGPGRVNEARFADVEPTAMAFLESGIAVDDGPLKEAIETGVDLARRCVQRSDGLCFITGEAGLVPRKDLHESFEAALVTIRAAIEAGID